MPPKAKTNSAASKVPAKKAAAPKKAAPAKKAAPKKAAVKVEKSKPTVVPKRKAPQTLEEFQEYADGMVETIESEIARMQESKEKGVKFLKSVRREVLVLRNRAPKLAKQKKAKRQSNSNGGFTKQHTPSEELRKFLGLKKGETISQTEAANGIMVYINLNADEKREKMLRWKHLNTAGRNLKNADNGQILELDATLKKLLGFDDYVKRVKAGKVLRTNKKTKTQDAVTDTKMYYYLISKLIQPLLLKDA